MIREVFCMLLIDSSFLCCASLLVKAQNKTGKFPEDGSGSHCNRPCSVRENEKKCEITKTCTALSVHTKTLAATPWKMLDLAF